MNLRQLRYAVTVAEQGHFGHAAAVCGVAQPTLSAQIRRLERALGVQLFERSTRRVLVTSRGADVIAKARAVLGAADALLDAAREASDPFTGTLRLGVIPTVAPYVLPKALPDIRASHPDLQLYLREDQTLRLVEQLKAGSLDVLLLALPLRDPAVAEEPLFEDPFLLAAPAGHPVASRDWVDEDMLEGHRLVLLEEGHCLREQALQVCRWAQRGPAQIQGTSLGTLVQMVASGMGVTLLPASAVGVEVHPGDGVVVRTFESPAPARTVGLAWRAAAPLGGAYRELGRLIAAAASPASDGPTRSLPPLGG